MGNIIELNQTNRQYEIILCGLQGDYITTLRSYRTFARGQIYSPMMVIRDDGTRQLTFDVPMKYIPEGENWENGELIDNPFYYTFKNGALMINTRTIKVIVKRDKNEKVFPFLITNVTDTRNGRELVCSVEAEGLAFNELGKIGYELSLNADLVELEYDKYRYKIFTEKDGDQCYYYTNKECTADQAAITIPHLVQILEQTSGGSTTKHYYFIGDGVDGIVGTNYYVSAAQITEYEVTPTIDYWLDKIFPNIKDDSGNIIQWLTPWCYEIRTNWDNYSDTSRETTKVYEDVYTSSWATQGDTIIPVTISSQQEKARYIDCSKSNKYNITQTLAETFSVFCNYEYKYDSAYNLQKTYEENGKIWTGKKCIFYNIFENIVPGNTDSTRIFDSDGTAVRADDTIYNSGSSIEITIDELTYCGTATDVVAAPGNEKNFTSVDYQKNLNSISRKSDTTDIISKMYVTETESDTMTNGMISIADTELNPTYENYILNFDYLHSIGAIDDYQYSQIDVYNVKMRAHNLQLIEYAKLIADLQQKQTDLESQLASLQEQANSAQETKTEYEAKATYQDTPTIHRTAVNPVSVIFVKNSATGNYVATIGLDGVEPTSLRAYSSYDCASANEIYRYGDNPSTTGIYIDYDADFDDNRYLIGLHAAANAPIFSAGQPLENTKQVWACITYLPENKYQAIISNMNDLLLQKEIEIAEMEEQISSTKSQFLAATSNQEAEKQEKQNEIQHFNNLMGPALKEGNWQKDDYTDPGQRYTDIIKQPSIADNFSRFSWDNIPFEGEQLNYYFATLNDQQAVPQVKTYYPYFDLSSIYNGIGGYEKNVKIELYYSSYSYTVSNDNGLAAHKYYFTINGIKQYYFETTSIIAKNTVLSYNPATQIFTIGGETKLYYTSKPIGWADIDIINLTSFFSHSGANGAVSLSIDAGLSYSFLKNGNIIKPILICTRTDLSIGGNGLSVARILYAATDTTVVINYTYPNNSEVVYPRIIIDKDNVNMTSAVFAVQADNTNTSIAPIKTLENYSDYGILQRELHPYITLYPTNQNTLSTILSYYYYVTFQVSRANEMLYLDAVEVAKENSQPRVSYELSVANLPELVNAEIEVGQIVSITDYEMKLYHVYGYISEYTLSLDNPMEDNIVIANYKTRFEDLFTMITASSEAMKTNQISYDRASNAFGGDGAIVGDILQRTIDNNIISFNYSESNVSIDDKNGILVTNKTPYTNGVYGAVSIKGGGIFCADDVDTLGNYIWHTGITPKGINANLITAGQLNTNKIMIFSGADLAFQWNAEGIFAYGRDEDTNLLLLNTYVKYSNQGLHYIRDGNQIVVLDWNGLKINSASGRLTLDDDGLIMYDTDSSGNLTKIFQLGRFTEEEDYSYGLHLYDKNGNETLITDGDGSLWLKEILTIGTSDETVGLYGGLGEAGESDVVRIWAGADRTKASFRVYQSGKIVASNAEISGIITATSGYIGGWQISADSIEKDGFKLSSQPVVSGGEENPMRIQTPNFTVRNNGDVTAANIIATGGQIGGWTISQTSLSSGNIIFNSASGSNENRISVGDTFILKDDGSVYATNADISGTIRAANGNIGQWIIDSSGLISSDGNVGLYAVDTLRDGTIDSVRIFSGRNENGYNFSVTKSGAVFANNATIYGDIYANNGRIKNTFLVGNHEDGIIIKGDATIPFIGSAQYSSGALGYGWRLDETGHAEFTDVEVRGKITSTVFEYNKISSIGGALYVSPTIYFSNASGTITSSGANCFITFDAGADLANISGRSWAINDIVKLEGEVITETAAKKVSNIEGIVSAVSGNSITIQTTLAQFESAVTSGYSPVGGFFTPGSICIFIGTDNRKNGLYLTSIGYDAPFIDVFSNDIDDDSALPAVRLGNLSGITDSDYFGGDLNGYGLYSSNAYLRGQLILPGAGITNQDVIKKEGSSVRIWAGGNNNNIADANFIVTENGYLYANAGIFKGTVIAENSEFSGTIKAAGIVIDDSNNHSINWNPAQSREHFFVAYNEEPTSFNDYVLDIGGAGISIWEGGLRAFSDFASKENSEGYLFPIYGYDSTSNPTPMPYIYLVDDGIVGTNNILNTRLVSYKAHFIEIEKNSSTYDSHSIIIDNGLWFNNLSGQAILGNIENEAFSSTKNSGLQLTSTALVMSSSLSTKINSAHGVYLNTPDAYITTTDDSAVVVGGSLEIKETTAKATVSIDGAKVVKNSTYGGLDFIV